jgi:signal peptidase I
VGEERFWKDGSPKRRREVRWERQRKKRRAGFTELCLTILIAFVLVFGFVRPFVLEAFRIPSESMVPTLEVGDRVLANKFVYRLTEPERGEVVVFESVGEGDDQKLIKRVVGVAGDEVEVRNGTLLVNGEDREEPYLNRSLPFNDSFNGSYGPSVVPEGHVFVMGDNRANSADSRVFGPLPIENIEGEAFVRFWPPLRIGSL